MAGYAKPLGLQLVPLQVVPGRRDLLCIGFIVIVGTAWARPVITRKGSNSFFITRLPTGQQSRDTA